MHQIKDNMKYLKSASNSSTFSLFGFDMYFIGYMLSFFIFSFGIVPKNITLGICLALFSIAPLETMSYMYIFSLPWTYVAVFSFNRSLSLLQCIVFVGKILLSQKEITTSYIDVVTTVFLTYVGIKNLLIEGLLTGISFAFYYIIAFYMVYTFVLDFRGSKNFWQKTFLAIIISTAFAVIYGKTQHTELNRWVSGLGSTKQLFGTLGTTRFGLYLCISLIYPLYFESKKYVRVLLCVLLSVAVLQTVSMTALAMLIGVFSFYFFTSKQSGMTKVLITILIVIIFILLMILWPHISQIDIIRPIAQRIENIMSDIDAGNINEATSGRADLTTVYMNRFNNLPLLDRIFGGGILETAGSWYSHNSYIDLLTYFGYFGIALLLILQIVRVFQYWRSPEFLQIILLKLLVIIVGATVSIGSDQYWLIWMFM